MMKSRKKSLALFSIIFVLVAILSSAAFALGTNDYTESEGAQQEIQWVLRHEENFNSMPVAPLEWTVDDYTVQDDEFYGENGYAIKHMWDLVGGDAGVETFQTELNSFTSFRKSYTFGESNWLTIEAYGRGENGAIAPESGGRVDSLGGSGAMLVCDKHTDAVIIRSTNALPDTYKLQATISGINVGGKNYDTNFWEDPHWDEEAWIIDDKMNGYDNRTGQATSIKAGPWRPSGDTLTPEDPFAPAYDQNGGYFLSIVDYADPKPHNNLFIHHHRKVAIDTDNNVDFIDGWGGPWSKVWNGTKYIDDGSRYISMLWANGNHPDLSSTHALIQYIQTGQKFYTFQPDTGEARVNTVEMVDKYIPEEEYVFTIIRTPKYYEMSVEGKFFYGGQTTYTHRKEHLPTAENGEVITWHFNQNLDELNEKTPPSDIITLDGQQIETWPSTATYPDYFFSGMPHINYYSGTMTYSNIKLWVPEEV